MEQRNIAFGESSPGPFADIVSLFVEERRQEADIEANLERREGMLDGLQACTAMKDGEVLDFELALIAMRKINSSNKEGFHAREVSYDIYKRHEMATLEIAVCYDVLRGAHAAQYGEFYGGKIAKAFFLGDGRHNPEAIGEFTQKRYDDFAARVPTQEK